MKQKTFMITFRQNGDEYTGWLKIRAYWIEIYENNRCKFTVDGIEMELDEEIISVNEQ